MLISRAPAQTNDAVAATARLGARLFLETRFSRFFSANSGGNANYQLTSGDPVMNTTLTTSGTLPGPFSGQAMNCRACHLVAEQQAFGDRTYADFAPRSPVPANGDGQVQTSRNSMSLVDALLPRPTPLFLHFDGQFASAPDLVIGTFTGRNFGWKPTENGTALGQIVHIIRQDDGTGTLAQNYGGLSYAQVFAGSAQISNRFRILPAFRLYDVGVTNSFATNYVSDAQIIQGVAAVLEVYLQALEYSKDTNGLFSGSPYDVFLMKNGLPRAPATGETPLQYSRRLLQAVNALTNLQYVADPADGHFQTHQQNFQFGATELAGLKIFFAQPGQASTNANLVGNCVACHTPPAFTDFLFHNTGTAQEEYESVHGPGSFLTLTVPDLSARSSDYDAYLPPTPQHPNATGVFNSPASLNQIQQSDLGLWNVFANPDFPTPQTGLQEILPRLLSLPAPTVSEISSDGRGLVLRSTNGVPGEICYVLVKTNLTSPNSWVPLSTNVFDSSGRLSATNITLANRAVFYRFAIGALDPAFALPRTIGLFKTPNLRDLGSSDPYFHTGRMNTIENVITFYQKFSGLARINAVRNAAPELSSIALDNTAIVPLAAFLRSLNEDYFDPTTN